MKTVRISLALCGMSMALAGAGCHTSGKHDACGRQVTPGCGTTVVEPGCKSTHASSGLGGCFGKDKGCLSHDKGCKETGCAPACNASPCCPSDGVCTKPVCSGCGTACGGTCGVVCNESLNTNLGVSIKQQMHVGEAQIDEDKMQKILDARKRTREENERRYNEYCAAQENYVNLQREKQLRNYIDTLYGSANCAGVGPGRAPICCLPAPPICPELPPPPACTPLRPAEIPMMIPVTLEVGVAKSRMCDPNVERTCMPACPKTPCAVPSRACAPSASPAPAAPAAIPPAPLGRRAGQAPVITPASGDTYIQQRSSVR